MELEASAYIEATVCIVKTAALAKKYTLSVFGSYHYQLQNPLTKSSTGLKFVRSLIVAFSIHKDQYDLPFET